MALLTELRRQHAADVADAFRPPHIPVIVLSSSSHEEDEKRAYELGAKAYWVKPSQIQVLIELVKEMRDTWVAAHCA